jgi:hypothetical protein
VRNIVFTAVIALAGSYSLAAGAAEAIKYAYDAHGRVVKVERTGSVNNGVKVEYVHDKVDNRTQAKTTGSPNN